MKKVFFLITTLTFAVGLSMVHAGNIDKGKALFESPILGGGTTGKTCKSCHKGGRNFGSDLFDRKKLTIMGTAKDDLAGVINFCIERPLGGKAIDPKGEEMNDLMSYMKTLVSKKK